MSSRDLEAVEGFLGCGGIDVGLGSDDNGLHNMKSGQGVGGCI